MILVDIATAECLGSKLGPEWICANEIDPGDNETRW